MDNNLNDINRQTWLYLLTVLDLNNQDYWYMRGMLDVILPEDNTAKFCNSPLIDYLYKIKVNVQKKKGVNYGIKFEN